MSAFVIEGLEVIPQSAARFAQEGIAAPTPVQIAAIPPVLTGRDTRLQSGTGTGKTLAYLLPLLQRVRNDNTFNVLIMAPSPELAMQIAHAVEAYKGPGVLSASFIGGVSLERQKERLKKHPQVMVGTPGRVLELIFARKIKTAKIGAMVLDEIDEILSPQNQRDLLEICSRPEFTAQVICVSATFGPPAHAFMTDVMDPDHAVIQVSTNPLSPTITHQWIDAQAPGKTRDDVLVDLLYRHQPARVLIFVNKLYGVSHLYNLLNSENIPTLGLSSERHKNDRAHALAALKSGDVNILVATDTAARGLDIKRLDWVIHYEAARSAETYLHRAGRVGRAGRTGLSVVLAAPREVQTLQQFARTLQIGFSEVA